MEILQENGQSKLRIWDCWSWGWRKLYQLSMWYLKWGLLALIGCFAYLAYMLVSAEGRLQHVLKKKTFSENSLTAFEIRVSELPFLVYIQPTFKLSALGFSSGNQFPLSSWLVDCLCLLWICAWLHIETKLGAGAHWVRTKKTWNSWSVCLRCQRLLCEKAAWINVRSWK